LKRSNSLSSSRHDGDDDEDGYDDEAVAESRRSAVAGKKRTAPGGSSFDDDDDDDDDNDDDNEEAKRCLVNQRSSRSADADFQSPQPTKRRPAVSTSSSLDPFPAFVTPSTPSAAEGVGAPVANPPTNLSYASGFSSVSNDTSGSRSAPSSSFPFPREFVQSLQYRRALEDFSSTKCSFAELLFLYSPKIARMFLLSVLAHFSVGPGGCRERMKMHMMIKTIRNIDAIFFLMLEY
jgi:hypothetical protein